jgi:hypothetical protein
MPGTCDQFERIDASDPVALLRFAARLLRIDADRPLLCLRPRLLASSRKGYRGVGAKAQLGLLAGLLVAVDPDLAVGPDTNI